MSGNTLANFRVNLHSSIFFSFENILTGTLSIDANRCTQLSDHVIM